MINPALSKYNVILRDISVGLGYQHVLNSIEEVSFIFLLYELVTPWSMMSVVDLFCYDILLL